MSPSLKAGKQPQRIDSRGSGMGKSPGRGHRPTFPCPLISHTLLLLRAGLATSPLSIPRGRRCFMSTTDLIWLLLAWVEKGAEPEAILSLVVRILRVRHARSTFPLQGASILLLWQELSSLSSQAHRQKHLESCLKDHRAGHHKGEKKGGPTPCMLISKGPGCSLTGRLMVIEGK